MVRFVAALKAARAFGEKRWPLIPEETRREIISLTALGWTREQVLKVVDISVGGYCKVIRPLGGVIRPEMVADPSPHRLSVDDRVAIYTGLLNELSYADIGDSLPIKRHRITIWREVRNNGGRDGYQPMAAQRVCWDNARRAKPTKLAANPELAALVEKGLARLWSPGQIAATLREEFGDDTTMTVSPETIYKSLYVQGRGELRKELTVCLRTGRARRKRRRATVQGSSIPAKIMIADRPAEIEDRAVPGHWEGDLIIGKNGASAVGTLVERTSRYVVLLHLPGDHTAETVRTAMTAAVTGLPAGLVRSITWDQGVEMAQHATFTVDTNVAVYFCDPHSPWQRGTNENTNGLLRQYMPKGTDLSVHTPADLQAFADSLNTRPRKTLAWNNPAQAFAQIVATTG